MSLYDVESPDRQRLASKIVGEMTKALDEVVEGWDCGHSHCLRAAMLEAVSALALNLAVRSAMASVRAVHDTCALMMRTVEFADGPKQWRQGYAAAMGAVAEFAGRDRDAQADAAVPDLVGQLAALDGVVGPIPAEVAGWMETVASGRLLEPAGWLRAQIEMMVAGDA